MKSPKGPAKPKKTFDKPRKPFHTRTYHRSEGESPTGGFDKGSGEERPVRAERPSRPERPVRVERPLRPERPFRPAFNQRAAKPGPAGRAPRPVPGGRLPEPVPTGRLPEPVPTGRPAPAAGASEPDLAPEAGAVSVSLPASLGRRLEAHAAELGVDMQSLVRVWLADKLRPRT